MSLQKALEVPFRSSSRLVKQLSILHLYFLIHIYLDGIFFGKIRSAIYVLPQSHMASMMGDKVRPNSVRLYSVLGGTTG